MLPRSRPTHEPSKSANTRDQAHRVGDSQLKVLNKKISPPNCLIIDFHNLTMCIMVYKYHLPSRPWAIIIIIKIFPIKIISIKLKTVRVMINLRKGRQLLRDVLEVAKVKALSIKSITTITMISNMTILI